MTGAAAPMPAPPRRRRAWPLLAALALGVGASFVSLDLRWAAFLEPDAVQKMAEFVRGFFPPALGAGFLRRLAQAAAETFAMSLVGTLLAAAGGLLLALPAASARAAVRAPARLLLAALRSVPELVWASLLLIAAGLGPLPGTLALALHTAGVLGRLFAEALQNLPAEPAFALRVRGIGSARVFAYATLPQLAPQAIAYALYRWENNIRAAAVLGVVGAGGLGQMLHVHLSLFQMRETGSVLLAMILLVALVDGASSMLRRAAA